MGVVVSRERFVRQQDASVYFDDGTTQNVYITNEVCCETVEPVDDSVYMDVGFCVCKAREDQQLVSGWANVAKDKNGDEPLDWQDDIIAPETLEKAALQFMMDYRSSGVMHKGVSKGTVVESIVFTKEKQAALGIPEGTVPEGWFITVKVHDPAVFAKVKDGTYRMFSIQGTCKRVQRDA